MIVSAGAAELHLLPGKAVWWPAERTLLLRNRQPRGDLAIGAVISADIEQFPLRHDCPLALPPLGQCSIHVGFRPAASGIVSATFSVFDSGGQVLRSGAVSATWQGTLRPSGR